MLYNIKNKKIKKSIDCLKCEYFDKYNKKCVGIGKRCFEFDEKTRTIIDPITKLPMRLGEE